MDKSQSMTQSGGLDSTKQLTTTQAVTPSPSRTPSEWHAEAQELLENTMLTHKRAARAIDLSESKQRDVLLATQAFYANSNTALRKKVGILEAIRWVATPIEKNAENEMEEVGRTIIKIDAALSQGKDPIDATDACLALRSQRPASDNVEDEVQDALIQLKECLELDSMDRLKKARAELLQMVERMEAMKQAMQDDIAMKGKLTEIDVRCIDFIRGRQPDDTFNENEVLDAGEWDASVAPWGSSQVQWNRVLQNFDDKELEGPGGVISLEALFTLAVETCPDLEPEVVEQMVVAADRDDDGTINHEEYIRCMRQFILFQSARGAIKDAKRLRMEVDRVIESLGKQADAAQKVVLDGLRQSMATIGSYISQLEDNLAINDEELERVQVEVAKLDQMVRDSQEPLRVAEARLKYRERRPTNERWNDNPEERLDTEVDGLKNAVCLLQDELEAMIVTQGRLSELKDELNINIRDKRKHLDIDTTCFNMLNVWMEFNSKYQVVRSNAPPPVAAASPSASKSARTPKLRIAPEAERYVAMVNKGLPRGAVLKLMKKDGVSPSLLPAEAGTAATAPRKDAGKVAVRKPAGWWVARAGGPGIAL